MIEGRGCEAEQAKQRTDGLRLPSVGVGKWDGGNRVKAIERGLRCHARPDGQRGRVGVRCVMTIVRLPGRAVDRYALRVCPGIIALSSAQQYQTVMPGEGPASTVLPSPALLDVEARPSPGMTRRGKHAAPVD